VGQGDPLIPESGSIESKLFELRKPGANPMHTGPIGVGGRSIHICVSLIGAAPAKSARIAFPTPRDQDRGALSGRRTIGRARPHHWPEDARGLGSGVCREPVRRLIPMLGASRSRAAPDGYTLLWRSTRR